MDTMQIFIRTEDEEEGAENVSMHRTQILLEETTCKESVKSERYQFFSFFYYFINEKQVTCDIYVTRERNLYKSDAVDHPRDINKRRLLNYTIHRLIWIIIPRDINKRRLLIPLFIGSPR